MTGVPSRFLRGHTVQCIKHYATVISPNKLESDELDKLIKILGANMTILKGQLDSAQEMGTVNIG